MKLKLIVRRPMFDHRDESPAKVARLAREIRELAEKRLGGEVVVDCDPGTTKPPE